MPDTNIPIGAPDIYRPAEVTVAAPGSSRFDYVVSLGSNCLAAALIERLGLKRAPMPFDWLSSTIPMVHHCIEDDFRHLLDAQYYKPIVRDGGHTEFRHVFYDTHWETNFNHYDPRDGMGRVYLERCVDRWRDMMASDASKLLIFMAQIFAHERDRYVGEFATLTTAISHRTRNAVVVGVTITPNDEKPGFVEACRIGSSRLLHYNAAAPSRGIEFPDAGDDVRMVRFIRDLVRDGARQPALPLEIYVLLTEINAAANYGEGPLSRSWQRETLHVIGQRVAEELARLDGTAPG